ncbi:hypothetical protein WKK05_13685 [Nostoc sp. UHCC 0302]
MQAWSKLPHTILKRIDHIYLSQYLIFGETFYDLVMQKLEQHKGDKVITEEPHTYYFSLQFQLTISPARSAQKPCQETGYPKMTT